MLADAGMCTEAEREVVVGLAVDVEFVGVVKDFLVAAARLEQRHHPVTGLDGLAAQRVVLQRDAHEVLDRCHLPQTLLDEVGHQTRVRFDPRQHVGVFGQSLQCAGQGCRGGVVTGGEDRRVPAVDEGLGPVLTVG